MNFSLPAKLLEATRLTKAGQLTEATAALQRMLGAGLPVNSVVSQARHSPRTKGGMGDGRAQPIGSAVVLHLFACQFRRQVECFGKS